MKQRLLRFARWAFVERWIDHQVYELLLMRGLFAAVIHDSINWQRTFSEIVAPNGIARVPLQPMRDALLWFGKAEHLDLIRTWIWVPLAFYFIGLIPVPAILSLLVVTVATGTLENSDGGIGHSYQIVSLILLAQLGSHVFNVFRKATTDVNGNDMGNDKGQGWQQWLLPGRGMQNHAIHLTKVTIAAAYVVCGIAKLIKSDFLWIHRIPFISVQITKANLGDYYNTLEQKTDFVTTRIPQLIVEYPNLARLFFSCGLVLELTAFLALRSRRWALCIGVSLIGLHIMIDQIMSLTFWTHMFCLAIFYVNLPGLRETWRERGGESNAG